MFRLELPKIKNAVAAIRVSSVKQGTQGDSPEAQKEQIEQFARSHNINIKKFFIFLESASKDEMRDIMRRMIGAEIRYSRMGYWVRNAPMGFMNEKVETSNGKRTILKLEPTESKLII